MQQYKLMALGLAAAYVVGCKGNSAQTTMPVVAPADAMDDESIPDEAGDIDELMLFEIRDTLTRKGSTISHCHAEGVDVGELDMEDKVSLTIGLTINKDGSTSDVSIVKRSKQSATLESCAIEVAKGWLFSPLPKDLPTSSSYTLQSY